jgi:hypothetical protein
MNYPGRKFMIFNVSELDKIDFSEVLETDIDTVLHLDPHPNP